MPRWLIRSLQVFWIVAVLAAVFFLRRHLLLFFGIAAGLTVVFLFRRPLLRFFAAGVRRLTWRSATAIVLGLAVGIGHARARPWPEGGDNVILDLVALESPAWHGVLAAWYYALPPLAAGWLVLVVHGAWRVWIDQRGPRRRQAGRLPDWPEEDPDEPRLVIGELHHPTAATEIEAPDWLVLDERGLYTGLAIFGAIGTGKTSACMNPFARQLFSWRADDPERRAAGLVLEVKGDFCHQIRGMMEEAGRGGDYMEIGLGGRWQWNPLDTDMDSYSLAYSVAALLNQLFGTGKEPFWQQASTNLIRWIIELHRARARSWVTLRDVYRCAISPKLLKEKINEALERVGEEPIADEKKKGGDEEKEKDEEKEDEGVETGKGPWLVIPQEDAETHLDGLVGIRWKPTPNPAKAYTPWTPEAQDRVMALPGVVAEVLDELPPRPPPVKERLVEAAPDDLTQRVLAVKRWYENDWKQLDNKLRTSIVEGVSVFLAMFDLPDVARVFCPEPPGQENGKAVADDPYVPPPDLPFPLLSALPPLDELIEDGRVLALNMPTGGSPALARAVGVLLKNAWLQALLKRPAAMAANPGRYFRPAVFVCDEYQAFATVGEDDPSGDEKAFALTRQCRCIPIVATQSISSLRSVLRGQDAWRTLIQTLRTRIFLSLSDASSAQLASEMCGKVRRFSPSWSFSEQGKAGFSLASAKAGGGKGSLGASKSYRETREPLFHARAFTRLDNCQAICLPYDGVKSLDATRVYLKPYYLPRDLPYWRAREAGRI